MKSRTTFGGLDRRPRRSRAPIVLGIVVLLFIALLWFLYHAGGEKPLTHVEKVVPAEKLGK